MKAKEVAGHYSETELINMLHLIRKMETGIKTGRIEDKFAVSYLLCQIL
jgi:DNA polymerase III delta subunit